jgi:predicted Zn-dependent protease
MRPVQGEAQQLTATVREIGARLQAAAVELEQELLDEGYAFTPVADKFDWTYYVVQSATPNAFCLPGGYVAVYTGILDITGNYDGRVDLDDLADPDKLAVVMGHEIGHALAHHGAERMSQQQVMQMGQMAVGVSMGDMDPRNNARHAGLRHCRAGRDAEILPRARNRGGQDRPRSAGTGLLRPPRGAGTLAAHGQIGGGQRPPEWMSTHPASETRAENFRKWMPDAIAEYESRCGALR